MTLGAQVVGCFCRSQKCSVTYHTGSKTRIVSLPFLPAHMNGCTEMAAFGIRKQRALTLLAGQVKETFRWTLHLKSGLSSMKAERIMIKALEVMVSTAHSGTKGYGLERTLWRGIQTLSGLEGKQLPLYPVAVPTWYLSLIRMFCGLMSRWMMGSGKPCR